MSSTTFDKDTILDITVNIIPLGILAFFLLAFVFANPWGTGVSTIPVLQLVLVGWMFVLLSILTYAAAKRIETGEEVGP
jgi:hypothetical protein